MTPLAVVPAVRAPQVDVDSLTHEGLDGAPLRDVIVVFISGCDLSLLFLMTLSHDLLGEARYVLSRSFCPSFFPQVLVCHAYDRPGPFPSLEALLGYVFQKCGGLGS